MSWPLLTNCFASVLISTNISITQPTSIHNDLVVDKWVEVYARAEKCRIMSPKESASYWQAELWVWDDYGMTLGEWGAILYRYRLKKILGKISAELDLLRLEREAVEDLKRECLLLLDTIDALQNP